PAAYLSRPLRAQHYTLCTYTTLFRSYMVIMNKRKTKKGQKIMRDFDIWKQVDKRIKYLPDCRKLVFKKAYFFAEKQLILLAKRRSEEHTSELQSRLELVCLQLLQEKN